MINQFFYLSPWFIIFIMENLKIPITKKQLSLLKRIANADDRILEDLIILPIRNDDNTKKSLVNFTPLTAQNFNKNKVFPYKSTWITPRFDV